MKVKALALILTLALIGATSVAAIPANWHRLAEIVGVVKPQSPTLVPIKIDLGTLQPAQSFYRYATTTLMCGGEYIVSKLIIAIPSDASEWYAVASGFQKLYLSVGVDVHILLAPGVPVVANCSSAINPGSDSAYWKFELQEQQLAYYSYKNWTPILVELGDHTVMVCVEGETSAPPRQVSLSLTLYLEIEPALREVVVPLNR